MDEKPDADQACAWVCGKCAIDDDGRPGVQRMVANRAAVGNVNRIGKQVVQVDKHRGDHDEPGALPGRLPGSGPAQTRDEAGDGEVQNDVEGCSKHGGEAGKRMNG